MRFLIDECLTVDLVSVASEGGHDAQHVAHIGKAGWKDWNVFRGGPEPWLRHEDHRHVGVNHPCHAREGRWVRVSRDGTLTVLTRREVGAVQIGSASYEPQAGQLNLTM
jgi:hypothetical protein